MTGLVRPQNLRGFRDLLPEEMLLRNEVVARITRVYQSYGFVPLDTPVLESLPTLLGSGGEEADKQIFVVRENTKPVVAEGEAASVEVGMRFDLTVPFARVIAQYAPQQIKLPFRRYHVGPVFRADDPQPEQGRFRQFTQLDADIAGSSTVAADAEIVAVMSAAFDSLGLEASTGYVVRVNNRKLVDAFLAGVGIEDFETARHVLRVLDKADKITPEALRAELGEGRFDVSGDRIRGVGLAAEEIDALLVFVSVGKDTRVETLDALEALLPSTDQAQAAVAEVREFLSHLDALGVSEASVQLDPSLARGLAYYTGTVYEATLVGAGVGSVGGGGRYDGLVSRFSDDPVAAVGVSIGIDRLVTGLANLGVEFGTARTTADVVVLVMPKVEPAEATRVAAELRAAGVNTELYVGESVGKVGKQLAYANAQGFRAAVMIGGNEVKDGTVTVKNLQAGAESRAAIADNSEYRAAKSAGQMTVPRGELISVVRDILGDTSEENS
ncbi:histidine--tRNA ligase [Kineosporia sp. NBRC 101731]|uniref:histidine--tRNA ligase n=1 Tax=Kineosporia sp. NBRC 101731 TaxID=3032199 RepID=UPI0024A35C40|nr:histidine--tRNA ligase [Kineosporia sp. NBRC 101731]GLY27918.1 histidine--tRNA ligase [Kineosporia sp. NBRC 101731]